MSMLISSSLLAAENAPIGVIEFTGNNHFTSSKLRELLRLEEGSWLNRTTYNPRSLKLDVLALQSFYASEGFIQIQVTPEILDTEGKVDIHFHLIEGPRFYIRSLELHGNRTLSESRILKLLDLKVDDVYRPNRLSTGLLQLRYQYSRLGKLAVKILDEVQVMGDQVDIRLTISEGDTYRIGGILISGLETYPESFIERELVFHVGELYDIHQIERTQQRIFSSQLFSSVEVFPKFNPADSAQVQIDIKVREYRNRMVQFDLGFGQEPSSRGEGAPPATVFGLETRWQPGGLFNTGNKIELGGKIGLRLDEHISFPPKSLYLNWYSPWFLGIKIPLRIRYYYEEQRDENTRFSHGIETSFLYKQGENYKLLGGVNWEYIKAETDTSDVANDLRRSMELRFLKQKLDNIITPSRGFFLSLSMKLNGTILGGRKHYLKFDVEYKNFEQIGNTIVFGTHFKAGTIRQISMKDDDLELAFYDKFWLGGNTSLRGWRFPEDYNAEGGLFRLQINTELRFPLFWRFGGEFFWDGGKLSDKFNQNLVEDWGWDIGAGLTLMTPIGPIRLDCAYPWAKDIQPTVLVSLLYLF